MATGNHNQRAKRLGLTDKLRGCEWDAVRSAAGGRCFYCGKLVGEHMLTIDHRVPLEKGGQNLASNIVAACAPCNLSKARHDEALFMKLIQFNVRINANTLGLINELAADLAVSQADVVKLAIRLLSKKEIGRVTAKKEWIK